MLSVVRNEASLPLPMNISAGSADRSDRHSDPDRAHFEADLASGGDDLTVGQQLVELHRSRRSWSGEGRTDGGEIGLSLGCT